MSEPLWALHVSTGWLTVAGRYAIPQSDPGWPIDARVLMNAGGWPSGRYAPRMNWGFEQAYAASSNVIWGLAGAAIIGLVSFVWAKGPTGTPFFRRTWGGAKREPVIASTVAGVFVLCVAIQVIGWTLGPAQTPPPATESTSTAPSPTSTPAPTPEPTPLARGGWGPARDVVNHDNRPNEATLNSVVDHPTVGDERGYMSIRPADDENAPGSNSAVAVPGEIYEVGVTINNDAKEGGETAEEVRLRLAIPAVVQESTPGYAYLASSNATPGIIWDGLTFVGGTNGEFSPRYVRGSAVLHTGGSANGTAIPDAVFSEGTLVGCDALDGNLPAGVRCESWVSFKVQLDQPNFEVEASVDGGGTTSWLDTHVAQPGEQITVRAEYKNTGTTKQNDVIVQVDLPENMHYVKGSTVLNNSSNDNKSVSDKIVAESGINVGNYLPGANAFVEFDVILDAPDDGQTTQKLEKILTVFTANGSKSAPLTFVWY